MRHRNFTFKIGRTSAHRKALLANAACSLIMEERIKTTVAKAKQIRRVAEKMITLGKRGSLHARRRAISILKQPGVVAHLFSEVAPRYADRPGGYTRILRLGQRRGDAAEMCLLEFVAEAMEASVEPEASTDEAAPVAEDSESVAEETPAEEGEDAEAADEDVADEEAK
ncbi:MAG: 50S ribosomal protein L17 [Lentisphaerae bacterium]|jgi:large subunit ribosomal protein L17|nr:50S ribosomal protein L17 [Lentisphaerota bacterium]MBT4823019.1 50S ribosomal protein L17 [Lentisphaerota bacterium]MBT5608269.1 50S ribosomal protein L17 [Lentisphaerota bacterium]MBT7061831.1 50S ribosomal protein L17 [Lentisphaerota bacterium]MBT7846140.1 50S ribosomal protein L17 [Lentisphaerota bacterium]